MASSARYGAQSALKTCEDHEHDELDIYCKTCKKPICLECTKGEHKHHQYEKMKKTAQGLRLATRSQKLKYTSLTNSVVSGTVGILAYLAAQNEEKYSQNTSEIESRRTEMHEIVDTLIEREKEKCKDHHAKQKTKIDEKRQPFEVKAERMKVLLESLDTDDFSDYDIIQLYDELHESFAELQQMASVPYELYDEMIFAKGEVDNNSIASMIGKTASKTGNPSSVEITLLHEIECGDTTVNSICPVSSSEAWIHCQQTTVNKVVDEEGIQKQSQDLKCLVYNFDLSKNGTTYFCDRETETVKSMDKSGKIRTFFSTEPLKPTFITQTRSGDLLISLVDELSQTRKLSSRRLVRLMTEAGEIMQEYEYDSDGELPWQSFRAVQWMFLYCQRVSHQR